MRQVSFTVFLSLLMATFACIGLVLATVMGRLGHSPFAWGLLGLVLGPIALLLALVAARDEPSPARLVASGDPGAGPVDVLVGIDGSPESTAATTATLGLLGGRMGRLILLAVTEIGDRVAARQEQARLGDELERQAEAVRVWLREHHLPVKAVRPVIPELVLRSGQPATILDRIAAEDGYGLLVVGPGELVWRALCLAAWRPVWPPGRVCQCWWLATGPSRVGRAQAAHGRPGRAYG